MLILNVKLCVEFLSWPFWFLVCIYYSTNKPGYDLMPSFAMVAYPSTGPTWVWRHHAGQVKSPCQYPWCLTELLVQAINSSPPSAAYMCQCTVSTLVQIMACRLYVAKPLSEPMLDYYQLDTWEQSSVKFYSKYKIFHSWKCIWKYRLRNSGHFVQGEMS